jgi:hypothetical protein
MSHDNFWGGEQHGFFSSREPEILAGRIDCCDFVQHFLVVHSAAIGTDESFFGFSGERG